MRQTRTLVVVDRHGRDARTARTASPAGALRCIARWGVAKTTLDDIAREAGCSRATIYRLFPGGKRAVLLATGEAEVRRLLGELADAARRRRVARRAAGRGHRVVGPGHPHATPALQYLMAHEPGEVLAHVAFDALDPLLALATAFGAPVPRALPRPGHGPRPAPSGSPA